MDIFDLSIDKIDKEMSKVLDEVTPEELLNELIKNGLEIEARSNDIGKIINK